MYKSYGQVNKHVVRNSNANARSGLPGIRRRVDVSNPRAMFDAAVHRVPPAGTAFIGSMVNKTLSGTGPRRQKADRNEGFAAD
jgi:hypothetical protein